MYMGYFENKWCLNISENDAATRVYTYSGTLQRKEIDVSQAERLGRSCLSIGSLPRSRSYARLRRNATMSHAFSEIQVKYRFGIGITSRTGIKIESVIEIASYQNYLRHYVHFRYKDIASSGMESRTEARLESWLIMLSIDTKDEGNRCMATRAQQSRSRE
ncbi:hypothetical protein EVAR_5461_1 [Eumeta japonica]|uniref:Uncharacterized protein n=1 Tax=Eumeta variegata TaxID=151549 RepID=A0A4C1TC42_EUMVA|nr:hypothetical protein EVAR_5461_1 [Eumeta japonica]